MASAHTAQDGYYLIYVKGVNMFQASRRGSPPADAWCGGSWDHAIGHGDRTSIRLDGGRPGKDRCEVVVGQSRSSEPIRFGIYEISAWVKTAGVKGEGVSLGLQLLHPEEPPIVRRLPMRGDTPWQPVRFAVYLPERTAVRLILQLRGPGTAWFDDVEIKYPPSGQAFLYAACRLVRHDDTSRVIEDPQATGGRAVRTIADRSEPVDCISGPHSTTEPPGDYVAWFRASVEKPTAKPVLELEVREEPRGPITQRTIRGEEFRATGVYQYFGLPFTRNGGGAIDYRVRGLGGAACRMDHIAVVPQRELWAEDLSPGAVVDQAQWHHTGYFAAERVGQTFLATGSVLERIDLVLKNRTDTRPGLLRVWEWKGNYAATVALAPLWQESVDLTGADLPQVRHWLPRIAVQPGKTYFLEATKPDHFAGLMYVDCDAYPGGMMLADGRPLADRDLAFVTYTRGSAPAQSEPPGMPPKFALADRLSPLKAPCCVSREAYRELLWQHIQANHQAWSHADGKHAHDQALYLGFAYRLTGDEVWAVRAIARWHAAVQWRAAHPGEEVGFPWLACACTAYRWIEGSPSLTSQDRQMIRALLLDSAAKHWPIRERGAMNRSMGSALGYLLMARLYPEHASAGAWREYAQSVWDDWFTLADTDENSLHYHAVWWDYVLRYAEAAGLETSLARPEVRRLMERYRDQLSPLGTLPPYGDCYGWGFEWGGYVMLFEKAAAVYHDGTFKHAAHAVLDHLVQRVKNVPPYRASYEDLGHLMFAYLWADDRVSPTAPDPRSVLQTRRELRLLPAPQRVPQRRWFFVEPGEMPDKLVMRSGADGLFAVFDLLPLAGHGHSSAAALVALTDHDTALMTDTCYEDRAPEDHSLLYLKQIRGGRIVGDPPARITVKTFVEQADATYCETEMTDYIGLGTRLGRSMLLAKDRFLWVHDEAEFVQSMTVSVGPLWFVGEVAARGSNWFDVSWNEPRGFQWTWRNGDRRLLVCFVPRDGSQIDIQYQGWKTQRAVHQWSPPWCLYQKYAGYAAVPGARLEFDTVLIPHGPDEDPARLAAGVHSGSDGPRHWVRVERGNRTAEAVIVGSRPEIH
jgi:hypothetical protein